MSSKSYLLGVLCAAGFASLATGQAIVDASGATSGSFLTITQALESVPTPSEIIVKNTGVYEESLMITENIIVRGEDPNDRPIIAMKGNASQPAAGTGDGVYLGGKNEQGRDLNITFSNFILIPNIDGSLTDDAITICPESGFVLNLTMENILIAPNNGANAPLATSVWDDPDLGASGVVRVPDDGIYLMADSGGTLGGLNGVVNADIDNLTIIGVGGNNSNGDAFICFAGQDSTVNISGLGTSYSSSDGSQFSLKTDWNFTGSRTNPSWVSRKNGGFGFQFLRGKTVNLDYGISVDNATIGVRVDADNTDALNLTNSLIANNAADGFWTNYVPSGPKTFTVANSTIYRNGVGNANAANVKLEASVNTDLTMTVTDSIIAGADTFGLHNLSAAAVNVSNSGLVNTGSDALLEIINPLNTGVINITNSINDDPQFVSVSTQPFAANSFDILGGAYAAASSTNGALNGWGDGPPPAEVNDWAMY